MTISVAMMQFRDNDAIAQLPKLPRGKVSGKSPTFIPLNYSSFIDVSQQLREFRLHLLKIASYFGFYDSLSFVIPLKENKICEERAEPTNFLTGMVKQDSDAKQQERLVNEA